MTNAGPDDRPIDRVEELFQAAADISAAERSAYLERECGDDRALRRQVESLLGHLGEAEGKFLETPPAGLVAELTESQVPQRVGRYRVIRVVGHGGMGVVYEAEQDSPHRIVALKLVRPGFLSGPMLRRFQFEGEVLGQLQHPGIAQIFEAGTARLESRGGATPPQPFFAMEFVRGEALVRHSETKHLDARARLELFARVCDAVEHAHQKGVIHRDLKPANILVDPSGQPKVLDFGVARLASAGSAVTVATSPGQLIGTLAYMSPEQVAGDPSGVDTRSDVYSLGVILFELLTGSLPLDLSGTAIAEAARRIGEEEPRRAGQLNPLLRGDIESICATALHKEKSRRYQSASRLGDDVRRFLAGDPVEARRDSTLYVLGKSLRRHRAPALAAALVLACIAAFAVYAAWEAGRFRALALREQSARHEADVQRHAAEGQAARATAVADFLRDMLTSADPNRVKGRDYTVRQLLDDASNRLVAESIAVPEVEAAVRSAIGTSYIGLAEFDRAEEHLSHALAAARDGFGESHPEVARVLAEQGRLRHLQARYDEGLELCLRALDMRRRLLGPDHAEIAASLDQRVQFLLVRGRYAEAEAPCAESLSMRRRLFGNEHLLVAHSLHGLALVKQHEGDFAGAEPHYRESLSIRQRALGPEHPTTAQTLFDFASLLRDLGRNGEAEEMFRAALKAKVAAFGESHPEVAWSLTGLATVLRTRAKYEAAAQTSQRALTIWEQTHGRAHPAAGVAIQNLAMVLRDLGQFGESESLLRERLSLLGGSNPRGAATALVGLSGVLRDAGCLEESREACERAREMFDRIDSADHPSKAAAAVSLAETFLALGEAEQASALIEAAVPQCVRFHGATDRATLSARAVRARALLACGEVIGAISDAEEALALALEALEPDDPVIADLRLALARCLAAGGDPAGAIVHADGALAVRSRVFVPAHWRIGEARLVRAQCLIVAGRSDEARAECSKASACLDAALGAEHPLSILARALLRDTFETD